MFLSKMTKSYYDGIANPAPTENLPSSYVGRLFRSAANGLKYICTDDTFNANIWLLEGFEPDAQTTSALVDPTVTDDYSAGFPKGSKWVNTVTSEEWKVTDDVDGAAIWTPTKLQTPPNNFFDYTRGYSVGWEVEYHPSGIVYKARDVSLNAAVWSNDKRDQARNLIHTTIAGSEISSETTDVYKYYTVEDLFIFESPALSTGATTLNINGLGPKPISFQGAPIGAGILQVNEAYFVKYNGFTFDILQIGGGLARVGTKFDPAVPYQIGDVVSYNGKVIIIGEDPTNLGNPQPIGTTPVDPNWGGEFIGGGGVEWETNVVYKIGDLVTALDSSTGAYKDHDTTAVYRCSANHTSSAGNTPSGSPDWVYANSSWFGSNKYVIKDGDVEPTGGVQDGDILIIWED